MNVIDWLLDGDPAIRWQVLRDLTDGSPDDIAVGTPRAPGNEQPTRDNEGTTTATDEPWRRDVAVVGQLVVNPEADSCRRRRQREHPLPIAD